MNIEDYKNSIIEKWLKPQRPYWINLAYHCLIEGKCKIILSPKGEVYLARFWISDFKLTSEGLPISSNSLLLHHFVAPDPDRHLHNHPQYFISTIISGGYTEELTEGREKSYTVGDTNRISAGKYHRVSEAMPDTWSIVITGPKEQSWGFLVDDLHVNWRDYLEGSK